MLCFVQSRYSSIRIYFRHRHKPLGVVADGRVLGFRMGILTNVMNCDSNGYELFFSIVRLLIVISFVYFLVYVCARKGYIS